MEINKKKIRRGSGKKSKKLNETTNMISKLVNEDGISDNCDSKESEGKNQIIDDLITKQLQKISISNNLSTDLDFPQPNSSKYATNFQASSSNNFKTKNKKEKNKNKKVVSSETLNVREPQLNRTDDVFNVVDDLFKKFDENLLLIDTFKKKEKDRKGQKIIKVSSNEVSISDTKDDLGTQSFSQNKNKSFKKKKKELKKCLINKSAIIHLRCNTSVNTEDDSKQSTSKKTISNKSKKKIQNSLSVPSHYVKSNNSSYTFAPYWTKQQIDEGFNMNLLIKGNLRINQNFYQHAYISHQDKTSDILIEGISKRNRALEGDEVIVLLDAEPDWKPLDNGGFQRTGTIIGISQKIHNRLAIGFLKIMNDKNTSKALLSPRDSRIPRIHIPSKFCPRGFFENPNEYKKKLFLARITDWNDTRNAIGEILECVGDSDCIITENLSILLENGIEICPPADEDDHSEFEINTINEYELNTRKDLRDKCIFTIDPATAKDLDDAVSCWKEEDDTYKIGVHISDVSYFLKEGTSLDKNVANIATSTYLINKVYHMLPDKICKQCSLTPHEDKLAFTVFFKIDSDGNVISHEFCRSIIRSCAQLSYEDVQDIIDNDSLKEKDSKLYGNFTDQDLIASVYILNKVAKVLRKKRFENGSIYIDQLKVNISIDPLTKKPINYSIFERRDSHKLIEELMLLANITVAEHILKIFPDMAILRCHPPPNKYRLEELKAQLEPHGIFLDINSSQSLHQSLTNYEGNDFIARARMMVLFHLVSKPMERAKYFQASTIEANDYHHYGLCMPVYTHFTSPIRRYPDILVHRLLACSLGYIEKPNWTDDHLFQIINRCNIQKLVAKRAGEQSVELYLTNYISMNAPMIEDAVVVEVRPKNLIVKICSMGLSLKIFYDKEDADIKLISMGGVTSLEITWPENGILSPRKQLVTVFSLLKVKIYKEKDNTRLITRIIRP